MPEPAAEAKRFTPIALAIFAFALLLRALHLLALRDSPFLEATLGDAATYDKWARGIAAGDWLGGEVFFQAPLYPYLLGLVYATLGDAPLVVRGLQAVLSAGGCALLASAGARLFSPAAGIVSGVLLASYAPSIFLDALLQKSVLDIFFVCLLLWLGARLAAAPARGLALALGASAGALALARENALLLVPVLGLWLLWLPGAAAPRRLALAAVFAAGVGAALLPVAARNWWIGGELHLTTSQFGPNFYFGNHEGATGLYQPLAGSGGVESERQDIRAEAERRAGRSLTPGEVSAWYAQEAFDYILSQPGDWLRLLLRKALLLLSALELVDAEDQYLTAEYSPVLRFTGWVGHFGVLAPLAVLGAFVAWPRRRALWWIHAAIAVYAASVLLFYVVARYRYPLVPFLALFAGAGLAGAPAWLRGRRPLAVLACAAAVAVAALVSNGVVGMEKRAMAAVTHANLGNFYRLRGELERAAGHYREALTLDPSLESAAEQWASTLRTLGRPADVTAVFAEALAARPDDAALHRRVAALLRAQGEAARARAHYERALALEPRDAATREALVALYAEASIPLAARGDALGALAYHEKALALAPEAPAALWGAAWLLATQRDPAVRDPGRALALAERGAAHGGGLTARQLETLAAAYAAAGRMEEALAHARRARAAYGASVPRRLEAALAAYARGEPLRLPLAEGAADS